MDITLNNILVRLPDSGRELFRIPEMKIPSQGKVLIQGPSGKGKTTLLHLIAGLFLPDEGQVVVGGKNLNGLSEDQRAVFRRESFGIVFQKLNLLDHLTARENIFLGLRAGSQGGRVDQVLSRLQIDHRADQRASNLSLGEQQRVAVARVLVARPSILLADEPTSSLDEANAQLIMDALFEASESSTLLMVSHDHRIAGRFQKTLQFQELMQ